MAHEILFDADVIRRYDTQGPRYTSYPTALQFHEGFAADDYRAFAAASNQGAAPLSLYFHLPFCDTVCYYCGCSKVVTKNRERATPYLTNLHEEIAMQGALFAEGRVVEQLHWGGGTPTFISHQQMRELMAKTREHFSLLDDDNGEYSIEIDPREVDDETLAILRELGFNRVSLGVQDFDPKVQQAVNRIQGYEQTVTVLQQARALGFRSINLDLIYGLPLQTQESFARTLEQVIAANPDRLSIFNYAHLPELFKPQRRIQEQDLPSPEHKLNILHYTIETLQQAGYVYIGMDHFARPDDELAKAQREGLLYRNFQGYSTHADCDLVAMGMTAIGKVGDSYSQNAKTLEGYGEMIQAGQLPVFRGIALTHDDRLRREIIGQLICHFRLDIRAVEQRFDLCFAEYFAAELQALAPMQADGLLSLADAQIEVKPKGKLLIRNVCMVFDRYLQQHARQRFSKVI